MKRTPGQNIKKTSERHRGGTSERIPMGKYRRLFESCWTVKTFGISRKISRWTSGGIPKTISQRISL